MNISSKQKILLAFLAVLILLKFVIVPIMEWQEEKAQSIARLDEQLSKGNSLLTNQDQLEAALIAFKEQNANLKKQLVSVDSSTTAFQLRMQKMIDEWINEYELSVRNSNWLSPYPQPHAIEHRLELSLNGNVKDFIRLMIRVEQHQPKISIIEASSAINNMMPNAQKLGTFNGRLVLSAWQSAEEQ